MVKDKKMSKFEKLKICLSLLWVIGCILYLICLGAKEILYLINGKYYLSHVLLNLLVFVVASGVLVQMILWLKSIIGGAKGNKQ
jgi:hypothetical protein